MQHILVGLDGSSGSLDALEWSAKLAAACSATLTAVTAYRPTQAEVTPADFDRLREEQRCLLDEEWVAAAREIVSVRTLIADGDPRDVVIATAESEGADLIVVGSGGIGQRPGFLHFGSVAEFLVHHTNRPLAVIPAGARGPVTKIVLGVDGSERNAAAVLWAADLASELGVGVVAVTVQEPLLEWTLSTSSDNWRQTTVEHIRDDWAVAIAAADVPLEAVAIADLHPVNGLLRAGEDADADLVVVGMRGVGGIVGLRAGGVAVKVAHHARIPIVMVPADLTSSL